VYLYTYKIGPNVKSFSFIEHVILCISWLGQSVNLRPQRNLHLIIFVYLCANPQIQVSTNMSIIVKLRNNVPTDLDNVTVSNSEVRMDCIEC